MENEQPTGVIKNGVGLPVRVSTSPVAPTAQEIEDARPQELNYRQDFFCQKFVELLGDSTEAYSQAYPQSNSAASSAACLMQDPRILSRIQEYLGMSGFTQEGVEAVHLDLLRQRADAGVRLRAVKLFYDLKGKIVEKKQVQHTHTHRLARLYDETKQLEPDPEDVIDGEVVPDVEGEGENGLNKPNNDE